jgi:hypothetical protein
MCNRLTSYCTCCSQAKDVAKLYAQLAKDVAAGKVELQQAESDLDFATEAAEAAGGIWGSKGVDAAVKAGRVAVNKQMLKLRHAAS